MKITSVECLILDRVNPFVRVYTDEGITGIGECFRRQPQVIKTLIEYTLGPALVAKDPLDNELRWRDMYRAGSASDMGGAIYCAIAGLDIALWDIKGKIAGLPLYQLLGGASREGVMVYGHANGTTIEDTVKVALDYQAQGYKAIRLQCGVPGMASTYGVSKDKYFYEPADADLPTENIWNTSKYLRIVPELF